MCLLEIQLTNLQQTYSLLENKANQSDATKTIAYFTDEENLTRQMKWRHKKSKKKRKR